jgi:aryl-alcohol dehydrogenase-like predicted oxidoreductase
MSMEMIRVGGSGLQVSRLCLGCMTYGSPDRGPHIWTLAEEDSRPLIRQALEAGINFFDTANMYSDGSSEEILGRAIRDHARREEVVIATKLYGVMRPGPNGGGLSRRAVFESIDASLRRLGVDHVDLYQIHRWDPQTPIEETLEALHDVVKAGKARYIGASSMYAWQFAKALYTADLHGWTRFISMQNQLNLLSREEEREMLPLCLDQKIGVLPWSPLARGRLTRDWDVMTERARNDALGLELRAASLPGDRAIVEAVADIARERGVTRAQVALAWVLARPGVTSPIVGAAKPDHIRDAVAALSLTLVPEEISRLEAPYVTRPIQAFS